MTKQEFLNIIDAYKSAQEHLDTYNHIGIHLFDNPAIIKLEEAFEKAMKVILTDDGYDWLAWWLYEKKDLLGGKDHQAYDKDGNIIPTDTPEQLWDNILNEYRRA